MNPLDLMVAQAGYLYVIIWECLRFRLPIELDDDYRYYLRLESHSYLNSQVVDAKTNLITIPP